MVTEWIHRFSDALFVLEDRTRILHINNLSQAFILSCCRLVDAARTHLLVEPPNHLLIALQLLFAVLQLAA